MWLVLVVWACSSTAALSVVCNDKPICTPLPWSPWGACSQTCAKRKLFTSKEKASTFLEKHPTRVKREDLSDLNINEECSESAGCDHEEVREYLAYYKMGNDVCGWMKNRLCDQRDCGAGYRCITTEANHCSNLKNYHVGCEGNAVKLQNLNPKEQNSCDRNNFSDIHPLQEIPITCKMTINTPWKFSDGEQFCMNFASYGGGYMITKDFNNNKAGYHIYPSTKSSHDVCMRYDSTPPKHCLEDFSCKNNEHILFDNRITRTSEIKLDMAGWFDPYPVLPIQASGIKSFEVNIHDVQEVDSTTLAMGEKSLLTLRVDEKHNTIRLPSKQPALYGVSLEVLDGAGNFKKARRFVLFDNSSRLLVDSSKKLFLSSGNPATNYTWQTHHGDLCTTWKDRYHNSHNINYNLLRKINPDFYKLYKGIYEQLTGQLPVNGTLNFNGVVGTRYLTSCDGTTIQNITLPNFLNQQTCQKYNLKDGQTYAISVIPVDVIQNSLKETITIHIDASVPDIMDISLEKDSVRKLFVHNSSDLSGMNITFEAFDIHSGIHSIEWMLGTTNDNGDLGKGAISVHYLKKTESCNGSDHCYCPRIGVCEKSFYWVNFNSLVKNRKNKGNHNREYFFALKVTNGAKLVSISKLDILTDDSPPEKGVVEEGSNNSPDIDFTSSKRIQVRWSDFIDHESGIKKYRVGISKQCLSKDEMLHNYHSRIDKHRYLYETTDNHISVQLEAPGQYFTSVIAYNHALESSDVSCSDGIVYDVSEPVVNDLILHHSKTDEFIGCFNSSAWLILNNLTAVSLQWTVLCQQKCNESGIEYNLIMHLPHVYLNTSYDESYADALCQKLNIYKEEYFTYIPSDEIHLVWNVTDEESQIHAIQIGFSSTKSQSRDPDILSFTPTKRLLSERMHSGIDPGIPFFINLKASNKANLETLVTLGPVIIDDTPPQYSGDINVTLVSDFVFVIWNDNTFIEEEQKEAVSNVLFKIGHGSTFFTPLFQGYLTHACPNFNSTVTCFKYPIRKIQRMNDDNTLFYFELYVYNTVGHSLIVRTENFTVPSRYPPTPGTVLDTSEHFLRSSDIDFIAKGDMVNY
ncbi:uncharacterized protein LOC133186525 [Saccostrea echinata]|uniref:uncharacterized protein LOC133186525 n=1 Tax=Saccostrea echinata TaxID=191078 RepID=UPI002A833331|nr:uncharacterized protein LOC133186525 [Saccostrea echinata]